MAAGVDRTVKGLREDFERWWVTATFDEKVSYGMVALMGVGYFTLGVAALVSACRGGGRVD